LLDRFVESLQPDQNDQGPRQPLAGNGDLLELERAVAGHREGERARSGSVKLLKVDNNALGPMLAPGRVDATIVWVTSGPVDARLLKQAGTQLSILPWIAAGLEGYGWSILASDKIVKEHPETVRRFVRAFIKTVEFTAKNPEKAGQDLHDLVPNTDEIRATVPLVKNEITEKYGMDSLDPVWLQKTWEWVAEAQGDGDLSPFHIKVIYHYIAPHNSRKPNPQRALISLPMR